MNNLDRISKIKPLINKYNWKGINYPSGKDDWKKFEESNVTVTFNVFYVKKNEYISYYISKQISNPEKQIILLMIPNGKGTIAVKILQ